ncbi:MAG: hypothetical protein Q4B26_09875, partial [Eubacteriales bacterium]|nr:hypothetical protein [Eubacteriales bacterium]
MKRKQILAVILAGALTTGMAPAGILASDLQEETAEQLLEVSEETPQEETSAAEASDTGEADILSDSSDNTPEAPAAEETPQAEIPQEQPTEAPAVEEAAPTATEAPTATPEPTPTETPEQKEITNEEELRQAIAQYEGTETKNLVIKNSFSLTDTIRIEAGTKINLTTAGDSVSLTRGDGFTGAMFDVSGLLSITGDDTSTGTLTIDGSGSQVSSGSIISVVSGGIFGMDKTATLTNNSITDKGGAINNAGTLILMGGTITGNTASDGGAIYNSGIMSVEGSISINGNMTADGSSANNIALESNALVVDGTLSESAVVGVHLVNEAEGASVLQLGPNAGDYTLAQALTRVVYDDASITLNSDGQISYPVASPSLDRVEGPVWTSPTSVSITCVSDQSGWVYAGVGNTDGDVPVFDVNEAGQAITAGESFTVEVTDIETEDPQTLYVLVKGTNNTLSIKKTVALDMSARNDGGAASTIADSDDITGGATDIVGEPDAGNTTGEDNTDTPEPIPTPTSDPIKYDLPNPIDLTNPVTLDFTIGGSDITDPKDGELRWALGRLYVKEKDSDADSGEESENITVEISEDGKSFTITAKTPVEVGKKLSLVAKMYVETYDAEKGEWTSPEDPEYKYS